MDHADLIRDLGGFRAVAARFGTDATTACRWQESGIPRAYWPEIVDAAAGAGLKGVTVDALRAGEKHPPAHVGRIAEAQAAA